MKSFLEKHCTPQWLEFIQFHQQEISFDRNKFIFKCKDKTKGLYIVKSGFVKVSYTQFDGTRKLISLAAKGNIIGHRGLGETTMYTVAAQTYTKTVLDFIPLEIFNIMAKASIDFQFSFMKFLTNELRKSDLKIRNIPVKNLIAEALIYNLDTFGFEDESSSKLAYSLPRKDLASYVGTTYETVVRKLAELNQDNLINIEGKYIYILDIEELRLLANPNPHMS